MCRSVTDGTFLPNPEHCRAFVECRSGFRLDRECPPGLLYDVTSRACLSSFAVDCGRRSVSPPLSDEELDKICVNVKNGGRIAHPNKCEKFFECRNGQRIDQTCNDGDLFESRIGACIYDGAVDCGSRRSSNNMQMINGSLPTTVRNVSFAIASL